MEEKKSEYYDSLYIVKLLKDVAYFDIYDHDNISIALSELKQQSLATSHIKYDFSMIRKSIIGIMEKLTSTTLIEYLQVNQSSNKSNEETLLIFDEEMSSLFEEMKKIGFLKYTLDNYSDHITFDVSELKDTIEAFYDWFNNYNCIRLVPFNNIRQYFSYNIDVKYKDTFVFLTKYSDLPESTVEDQAVMSLIQQDAYPEWVEINNLIVNDELLNTYYERIQNKIKHKYDLKVDNNPVIELFFNICDEEKNVSIHPNEKIFGKHFMSLCLIHSDHLLSDDLMLSCICSPISYQERLEYINRIIQYLDSTKKDVGPASDGILNFIKNTDTSTRYKLSSELYELYRRGINEISTNCTEAGMTDYAAKIKLSKRLRLRSMLAF